MLEAKGLPTKVNRLAAPPYKLTVTLELGSEPLASKVTGRALLPLLVLL